MGKQTLQNCCFHEVLVDRTALGTALMLSTYRTCLRLPIELLYDDHMYYTINNAHMGPITIVLLNFFSAHCRSNVLPFALQF